MSTTQGSPKRACIDRQSVSDLNENDDGITLPNGYVFTDRLHIRSETFRQSVELGFAEEIEIKPGYTPKSLMELSTLCFDVLACYDAVYVWINEGAYAFFMTELDEEEENIRLSIGDCTIDIVPDDDEAARRALAFILDWPRHESDDDPRVQIQSYITLHPECLQSLFSHPEAPIEFLHTNLTPEVCAFIFANGNNLSFVSCYFEDEGQAMIEALNRRNKTGSLSLQIVIDESSDQSLPMSDEMFDALLDWRGENPVLGLSLVNVIIEDTWADTIAKANVQSLNLIECEFEGTYFVECLARNQALGVGPKSLEIEIFDLYLIPFFKGLEANQHLTQLKLHFVDREYSGWEVLCYSLAHNDSLKEVELSLITTTIDMSGHILDSISHNTSIKKLTIIINSNLTILWLCTEAIRVLATNRVIEQFYILEYACDEYGRFKKAVEWGALFQMVVAPFLARNVMQSRIRVLKENNASPALVGAALANVSAKESNMKASLLWQLLSDYSCMVASQFS